MSRQEEQELNKALYASLQENRRSKSMPSLLGHNDDPNSNNGSSISNTSNSNKTLSTSSSRRSLPTGSKASKLSLGQRRSLRTGMSSPLRSLKRSDRNCKDLYVWRLNVKCSCKGSLNLFQIFYYKKIF